MLKGKSVIELTNIKTGEKERHEDCNLVTEAVQDVLSVNLMGMLYNNTYFNGNYGEGWMLPLKKNIMGGILLYQEELEEKTDNIYAPYSNPLIGYASDDANNTEDVKRGSRNLTESKEIDNGFRFVWDFATSQANGTISAIALTNTLAGKGTKYDNNYLVRLGSCTGVEVSGIDAGIYRNNKRTFIGEGYRLEMISRYDSTQAVLKKYPADYLHASLTTRSLTKMFQEPIEETTIEVGHAPVYSHYTGGKKDGTEAPYYSGNSVYDYFYHGKDGKWYGIAKRYNYKYSYSSGDREYYDCTGYEWYLDTIDGTTCTSQKIAAPSGVSEFYGDGMSGKWMMCHSGTVLYRLDTTNVANIEKVSDITYVSDYYLTYIVDDDMVIHGWYFIDGEPRFYVGSTYNGSNYSWGRSQVTRYKTYALREWIYGSSGNYYTVKELDLYTPYLATINNLGTPVIKTADKTMKITYTITEE